MAEGFNVLELTIRKFHEAIRSGEITSRRLAEIYLERIKRLDQSTGLNSMIVLNPNALTQAQKMDEEYREAGRLRALHGVPAIIKDNYNTFDLQTTGGSMALKGSVPPDDSTQVRKLREAGAVILGKSNMAEWAFSPFQTVSSIAGTTRNPYDLDRVPAGSSGGTAAAVAANLGLIGLGTDTGNSIRGPSSHCCLVGIRSTMGLTSREGIIPLYLRNDIGGPMCRTVEDAVRVLDVIAGYDPSDKITTRSIGSVPESYMNYLKTNGLTGKRIGVFRYYTDQLATDPEVLATFQDALECMCDKGATLVDPFMVPDFAELSDNMWCNTFRHDLNRYLKTLKDPPYRSLEEIYASGLYSDSVAERLKSMVESDPEPTCGDLFSEPRNVKLRETIIRSMDIHQLDAFVYPTWSNPPRLVGDMDSPAGDNSQSIPPHTGLPAFTVPMGFSYNKLPTGLQIVGRLFDEPTLIEIAYGYERASMHRRPPEDFD
jgi:amidase